MRRNISLSTPNLKLGMWNIEGLTQDKINDPHFYEVTSNLHVISLVETWSDGSQDFNIPGFDLVCSTSRKRNKRARRNSGGISVYCTHKLKKGIKALKTKHTDITWN